MKKKDALEDLWRNLEENPVPDNVEARQKKLAALMTKLPDAAGVPIAAGASKGAAAGWGRAALRYAWVPLAAAACIAAVLLLRTPAKPTPDLIAEVAPAAEPAQTAPALLADGSPVEFVPKNGLNPEQTLIPEAFVPKNTEIPEQTIRSVDPAASATATAPQAAPAPQPATAPEPPADPFAETPSPRRRNHGFALSFFASGSTASDGASKVIVLNKIASDPESFISVFPDRSYSWLSSLMAYADTPSTTPETSKLTMHHDMPLNVGASISYGFTRRLALESGLTYSYLHSDITKGEDNYSRQLHYLGIPLALQFKVLESRGFSAYVSGGGSVAYCLGGRMSRIGGNSARINDHPTQLALTASAGAQYRIAGPFCLFGEVACNRYFDDGTSLDTYYSANPWAPSFKAGVRFQINKKK